MKSAEKFIQDVAREAGDAVLKRFGKDGIHYMKSEFRFDAVTKADLLSEKMIISRIKRAFPEHGIISEERGAVQEGTKYVWIIDPIDGTLNFASGIPMFGVMLCLVSDGDVKLSVIYLPAMKELYFAKAGKGAYLNGKKIRCSQRTKLHHSFGLGSTSVTQTRTELFLKRVFTAGAGGTYIQYGSFNSMSSNACFVAAGRRDWIVPLVGSLWDFAPAYLLLKESGCKVTDTEGRKWRLGVQGFVAANPRLHKQLLKLTKNM